MSLVCPSCGDAWDSAHRCAGLLVMFPAPQCGVCGGHHYPLDPHDFERELPDLGGARFISEPWKERQPIGDPPLTDEDVIRRPRVPSRG